MKATAKERYALDDGFGGPSHVLGLGPGRALALSRTKRRVALLADGAMSVVDLAALAREPPERGIDLAGRGAPFRVGDRFAVAFRDVLHLFDAPDSAPVTLPVTIPERDARRERGRLEPVLACSAGEGCAILGLHAGAASVHAAHRLVRMTWDTREAAWDAGDVYLDPNALGVESTLRPESDPHPPALHSVAAMADGGMLVHTTGPSRNHMRYGMACSRLAWLDREGRTVRTAPVSEGYGQIRGERVLLEALHHKPGGLDFAVLDLDGATRDTIRVTKKAMAPVSKSWLTCELHGDDLWLADDFGAVVRLELA